MMRRFWWRILFCFLTAPAFLFSQSGKPVDTNPEKADSETATTPAPTTPAATSPLPNPGLKDSTLLKAFFAPQADYPAKAADEKLQGQVWVKLSISETGDVEQVELVSGNPVLGEAAMEAFKRWKFRPYIKNGKPVKVSTKLPMDFVFTGQVKDIEPIEGPHQKKPVWLPPGVVQGMLVHKVTPVYPDVARRLGIKGTVLLNATIGKDGRIEKLVPQSGPEALVPAAMEAVQQWRYTPYLVDNEPVEVDTKITVNFSLQELRRY